MQPQSILHFWFTELPPKQHFAKDAALEEAIRTRFGVTLEAAALCELFAWRATPYEFSQVNNNEMGILIQRTENCPLYKDSYEEAERIIRISNEVRISPSTAFWHWMATGMCSPPRARRLARSLWPSPASAFTFCGRRTFTRFEQQQRPCPTHRDRVATWRKLQKLSRQQTA